VLEALDEALAVPAADADPVAAAPDVDPAVVVPAAADDVGCAVAGATFGAFAVAPETAALLPSVTTPLVVTV
jgi:hypothetical protein